MNHLVQHASLNGTGIRVKYNGGYIALEEFGFKMHHLLILMFAIAMTSCQNENLVLNKCDISEWNKKDTVETTGDLRIIKAIENGRMGTLRQFILFARKTDLAINYLMKKDYVSEFPKNTLFSHRITATIIGDGFTWKTDAKYPIRLVVM